MSRLRIEQLRTRTVGPVDLEVAAGEFLWIGGASGAGKTLLLRAIADLDPHDGSAFLDGKACESLSPTDWRRRVALLGTESYWWAPRVGAHFRCHDHGALERLGFTDAVMGWEVEHLSTGERQRLGLLRLLCNQPRVLLLDEPTANLDPDSARRVETLIVDYTAEHQAAVMWVGHDPEQARRLGGRRLVLADGRLRERTSWN